MNPRQHNAGMVASSEHQTTIMNASEVLALEVRLAVSMSLVRRQTWILLCFHGVHEGWMDIYHLHIGRTHVCK
jgi:hypothetical protein